MANDTKPTPSPIPPAANVGAASHASSHTPSKPARPVHGDNLKSTREANAHYAHRLHEERVKEMEQALENEKKKLAAEENLDINALTGELGHGETGWLLLDQLGQPTGAATAEPPPVYEGMFAAPVKGYFPVEMDTLVTPSGAPITAFMNPQQDPRDPGMEARNADGYKSDYNDPSRTEWQTAKPKSAPAAQSGPQPKAAPAV
jgi:hypothetical protein